jgi:eukaryotic-like serine/threonine-protein kinase
MVLSTGSRLGPYEILSALGAGGMGEVYRARDTKLNRDVALKILPEAFALDPERLARFKREAQVLASLNHPHIAAIYGFEDSGPTHALVLELVEGPTLADRIAKSPVPLEEALPIAKQIAEALGAAHEQGIIHRDLKPANIKVREDGAVKVLDFGLAKAMDPATNLRPDLSNSPTITSPAMMTGVGMLLGTAAYMSPEQAKGRPADKRSDVWAFGCVLYEMLTGKRAFEGEDVSDTLAAVLRAEPDESALARELPSSIRTIVRRCLQKDRKSRLSDISIALFLLNEPLAPVPAIAALPSSPRPFWTRGAPIAAAALSAAAITAGIAWALWPSPAPPIVSRLTVPLGEGQIYTNTGRQLVAISPDGTRLVYVANRQLYLRGMSDIRSRPIAGTESTQTTNPVFSPDGQSIAFYAPGGLKRVAIGGGAPVTICAATNPFGMSWDRDQILFGQGTEGIMRVSANGGTPERLVAVKDGELAYGPQMLPGGQAVVFTLARGPALVREVRALETWDTAEIVVQSLKSGERRRLVAGGSDGRYVSTGHLVYALGGVVFAVRFDLKRLAVMSGPVPMIEGVLRAGTFQTGVAHFASSNNGTLIFIPGPLSLASGAQTGLALMDRQGALRPLNLPPAPYEAPRVSPDGGRVAVDRDDGKESNVWIYELSGTSAIRQLTFGGHNRFPIWSPDGQRVAFQSDRDGDFALFSQRADGGGGVERLTKSESGLTYIPESWAPDGKTILVTALSGSTRSLRTLSIANKETSAYGGVQSKQPMSATFSPDGRWVAYSAASTDGGTEIFVQPFPATTAKYKIVSASIHPFWSPDGKELFFSRLGEFARVGITTAPSFTFSVPIQLSRENFINGGPRAERNIDVTPDGKYFVGVIRPNQLQSAINSPAIQVIENWFEELKQRVSVK